VERMVEALHADVNSMLTAAYAEFQHWLQNVKTFERLAKAVARGGVSWLLIGLIAVIFLVMAPQILPMIERLIGGLWR